MTSHRSPSFDLCVFIGRFQPFHAGHARVVEEGLRQGRRMVVLVGSANEPRSFRNPFTAEERIEMIRSSFGFDPRLVVLPLEDSEYNLSDWLERANQTVERAWSTLCAADASLPGTPKVALIGHPKDASSYYLNLFPAWGSIGVPQHLVLNATDIRTQLFGSLAIIREPLDAAFTHQLTQLLSEGVPPKEAITQANDVKMGEFLEHYTRVAMCGARGFLKAADGQAMLPAPVNAFLNSFLDTDAYREMAHEYAFVARYQWAWRLSPYPPQFLTADAVVIKSGHVLMVKRRAFPGKGLWALPGGFVEKDEPIEVACLRELAEETALKVPPAVLKGSVRGREVFDDPFRSSRGRTVTHAFLIDLGVGPLPKIKTGGQADDEETFRIAWVPLARLRRDKCFEDHYSIIRRMVAQANKG